MAISANVPLATLGSRVSMLPATAAAGPGPAAPAPAAAPAVPATPAPTTAVAINPAVIASLGTIGTRPIDGGLVRPLPLPLPPFPLPQPAPPKVTTAIALATIDQLNHAAPASIRSAINAATSRQLTPDGLMDFLVRKVKISEVLGQSADHWASTTVSDFADAFQLQPTQLETMDSIVSLAVLNDRDLESELRGENTPPATSGDLLQNRRIVWQWPAAGTVLTPPYLILVAVDAQDAQAATDVVQAILGQLSTFQGFKLPSVAIQKLS